MNGRAGWVAVVLPLLGAVSMSALGQTATPTNSAAVATFQDCQDCPVMVLIPAGKALLGASIDMVDRKATERARREATLATGFALAQHEVTRAQYAAFVAATRYAPARETTRGKPAPLGCNYWNGSYGFVAQHDWRNPGFAQRDDEPVVCVSFADAEAFAAWLTKRTGRSYRIPSAVEFEYASRAGSDAAWFWGNNSEDACRYANIADHTLKRRWPKRQEFNCDDGFESTAPVKSFAPNRFGLYDMIGNAWEWTADCWHESLDHAPLDGRPWLEEEGGDCEFRTPMGGAWISGPGWSRSSVRSKDPVPYRSFLLGFRVAAALDRP